MRQVDLLDSTQELLNSESRKAEPVLGRPRILSALGKKLEFWRFNDYASYGAQSPRTLRRTGNLVRGGAHGEKVGAEDLRINPSANSF